MNENVDNQAENMAVQQFNAQFSTYEGEDLSATQIRSLFSAINASNESNSDHIIELNEEGITDANDLEIAGRYNVELSSFDDDGYVNEITITDSNLESNASDDEQQATETMDKLIFNSQFTSYVGEITGEQLNKLLDTIQKSNNENSEHQIGVKSNNLRDFRGITAEKKYTTVLTYDANGYINVINIDENV